MGGLRLPHGVAVPVVSFGESSGLLFPGGPGLGETGSVGEVVKEDFGHSGLSCLMVTR